MKGCTKERRNKQMLYANAWLHFTYFKNALLMETNTCNVITSSNLYISFIRKTLEIVY